MYNYFESFCWERYQVFLFQEAQAQVTSQVSGVKVVVELQTEP